MVYVDIEREGLSSQLLVEKLRSQGVLLLPTAPRRMRAVTHYHLTGADIALAVDRFRQVMSGEASGHLS